jgi:sulfur-carrier protein
LPVVWIPAPLRDLAQGKTSVIVPGSTIREVVENLEGQFPGIRDRLCEGDKLRPNVSVLVDGHIAHLKLRARINDSSEVHFVLAISGG